jgi:hypothetical protein
MLMISLSISLFLFLAVCLVCYKIMGPSDFGVYRTHIKEHDARQLEKVTVSLPDVGRGGPGLRKNPVSDADLEHEYLDAGLSVLRCKKCGKTYRLEEKVGFRKHLNYHAHKEKNYVYVCSQCTKTFSDHSNLKRHVQSVHEKQVFRQVELLLNIPYKSNGLFKGL